MQVQVDSQGILRGLMADDGSTSSKDCCFLMFLARQVFDSPGSLHNPDPLPKSS